MCSNMKKKWQLKEKAQALRGKGLSYKEIIVHVPVAKSTISKWCKNIELTTGQIARLRKLYDIQFRGAKANALKRQKEIKEIKTKARKEIKKYLLLSEFKIAGTMLYWAEGSKTQGVCVTNSDPRLIQFMMKWFRKVCKVPEGKFRAHIHFHSGQDQNEIKQYWSKLTGIPLKQFYKSHLKKEGTGQRKRTLYNGTIAVRINDEDLRHRILTWVEEIAKIK